MKRTIIKNLLAFVLCCFISSSYADNYDERCFIAQIKAGTTQAEIDALLTPFNLIIEDGPTTEFINQFVLICMDPELGFPDIDIPVNNNGEVDINGVILAATTADADNDNIFDAIGLNYDINALLPPTGTPSSAAHHPLAACGLNAFSINTAFGTTTRKVGLLDTGIKIETDLGLDDFFDPYDLGWNIVEDTPDPTDDNGHGSHMASSLMLDTPNDFASVLTLKVFKTHDLNGIASIWGLIEGIDKAILCETEIINMSNSYIANYDHRFSNAPLKIAIEEALDIGGILFVTAAGNNAEGGLDNDDPNGLSAYPASFPNENILSVAALNCYYTIPAWSNYGATSVDIAAPGVDIWGLNHIGEYTKMSGSSSATALTSRVASMLATQQTVFNYAEIKCAIINGANESPYTSIETLSQGYLDAVMAQNVFDTGEACAYVSPSSETGSESDSGSGGFGRSYQNSIDATIQNGEILSINSNKEQIANLRIFNLLGQSLSSKEVVLQKGQNNIVLEIPDYPFIGTYLCQLQYGDQSETIKFIK